MSFTPSNVWYIRDGQLDSGNWRVSAYRGPEHPDGTVVAYPELGETAGAALIWRSEPSERGIVRVRVPLEEVPDAPPLWFVHVDEPKASPSATNLVAFRTDDFEPGTIISRYTFATAGVHNDKQAGAVRWYRDSAIVHQVFVSREWRRQHVGSSLLYAADALHQSLGWEGHLHSDGRRTTLGQQFIASIRYPGRFAPLEQVMPPMDPDPAG